LAEVGVQVDEPRGDEAPAGVEHPVAVQVGADGDDVPVGDDDVGGALAGRVDDAPALDDDRAVRPS
jgi:hypothetical protein